LRGVVALSYSLKFGVLSVAIIILVVVGGKMLPVDWVSCGEPFRIRFLFPLIVRKV
jgi:hypothetical protein